MRMAWLIGAALAAGCPLSDEEPEPPGTFFCCAGLDGVLSVSTSPCDEASTRIAGPADPAASFGLCGNVCCVRSDGDRALISQDECEGAETTVRMLDPLLCGADCCTDGSSGVFTRTEGHCDLEGGESHVPGEQCDDVCCEGGTNPPTTEARGSCAARGGTEVSLETCDPASTCTCDTPGATFSVVSGCEPPAFDAPTTAAFCSFVVTNGLGADPDTHELEDGAQLGVEGCTISVDCP